MLRFNNSLKAARHFVEVLMLVVLDLSQNALAFNVQLVFLHPGLPVLAGLVAGQLV